MIVHFLPIICVSSVSSTVLLLVPVSRSAAGTEAGLWPRILSSSLKNLQDFLPLSVSPLWSFTCLYSFFTLFPFSIVPLLLQFLRNILEYYSVPNCTIHLFLHIRLSPDSYQGSHFLIRPQGATSTCWGWCSGWCSGCTHYCSTITTTGTIPIHLLSELAVYTRMHALAGFNPGSTHILRWVT